MNQQKVRLRQRIRLAFTYTVMTIATLVLVVICLMLVQGYRLDFNKGTVRQGGMVQFDSRPDGATIQIDAATLANRTATRIVATSGQHTVTISKDGFVPWQKQVNVKAGSILWLNYVKLVPTNIDVKDAMDLSGLDSAVPAPDKSRFAIIQNKQQPAVDFLKVDNDKIERKQRTLATDSYTNDGVANHAFTVESWSRDNKLVLISHTYDDSKEYLVTDLDGKTQNITRDLGVQISKLAFDPSDSQTVYVLTTDSDVRRIKLSDKTLSGPLVSDVSDFYVSKNGWISYATKPNNNGDRTVGYLSKGASKPRALQTFKGMSGRSLNLAIEEYYYDTFALITKGKEATVKKVKLPASDSTDQIRQDLLATLPLASDVSYAGFSPNEHLYVYAQAGQSLVTYNLELKSIANVSTKTTATSEIAWLDNSHIMRVAGGVFEFGDYDGTNMHTMATDAVGSAAMQSSNNRFLYYFRKHNSGKITASYIKMYD